MVARILIVEDEANLRFSIRQTLRRAGHEVAEEESVSGAWEETRRADFDAVLTDINLGGDDGIDLVRRLREDGFDGAIVVMTAYGTIESAVGAMKVGADDYLQKPLSLEELVILIDRLLEHKKLRRRLSLYQRLESTHQTAQGMVGDSPAWKETLRLAERLASAPVAGGARGKDNGSVSGGALPTILILGETGTGKGLLARFIHQQAVKGHGGRADEAPFVHVNCSALPPSLVESELFGHEKGAFTDAKASRAGLFEMAEGGTIFLDEIGDMPLELQAKILTIVEEGLFRRVGGSRDKRISARIITATNQPLEERVDQGKFRRDLLYRLNALTIRIPPLRERADDAVLIAQAMLERFAREYGRAAPRLLEDARAAIRAYPWPGNVRELINTAQRLAMLSERAEIGAAELGLPAPAMTARRATLAATNGVPNRDPRLGAPAPHPAAAHNGLVFDFEQGTHKAEDVERELIIQALRRTRGNVSKAAKLIGMQRSSLRYRIDRFGLQELVQEIASR
jgi:DNA-binding NtrC family response regulator